MKLTLVRCGAFAIASRTMRKTDGVDSTGGKEVHRKSGNRKTKPLNYIVLKRLTLPDISTMRDARENRAELHPEICSKFPFESCARADSGSGRAARNPAQTLMERTAAHGSSPFKAWRAIRCSSVRPTCRAQPRSFVRGSSSTSMSPATVRPSWFAPLTRWSPGSAS